MFGFSKVKKAFHIPTRREREEAFLAGAKDRYDLEYRMRQIERGQISF
ncbi:DUF3563 family protein [Rhizobium sp. L1K21]|nr:DUF3563 family protein [Rhizobium sp. L1K21]MCO6186607.1 DUF3563 domain-containing protein [Rhizobium sp. L1K21]